MTQPKDETIRTMVKDWMYKAELDMKAAETLVVDGPLLHFPACAHWEQAAEKYLKAYLTSKQVEFPKTHSIQALLDVIKTVDAGLATKLAGAAALTPFGVEMRYPKGDKPPDPKEAQKVKGLAKMVQEEVEKRLESPNSKL